MENKKQNGILKRNLKNKETPEVVFSSPTVVTAILGSVIFFSTLIARGAEDTLKSLLVTTPLMAVGIAGSFSLLRHDKEVERIYQERKLKKIKSAIAKGATVDIYEKDEYGRTILEKTTPEIANLLRHEFGQEKDEN